MKHLLAPMTEEERRRRDVESVWDDVRPWMGRSMQDHAEASVAVIRFADAVLAESPNEEEVRRRQDPLSEEAQQTWMKLVARNRQ